MLDQEGEVDGLDLQFLKEGQFVGDDFLGDVGDELDEDRIVPILQVDNCQGLCFEVIDLVVVEQVFHNLLAISRQEERTNFQQEFNQFL